MFKDTKEAFSSAARRFRLGQTSSRYLRRALTGVLVACTGLAPAQAAPVLFGDVEQIVTVDASDCPTCTSQQFDVLERGVDMMLREMRKIAVSSSAYDSPVCVAEASLAKDLAVTTFEAYRAGAISEIRWRDGLRAKANVAGQLTDPTIEWMLQDFRDRLEERFGIQIQPGSLLETQVDIYASGRYAQIFEFMARGLWQNIISDVEEPVKGVSPVVDAVLNLRWRHRSIYNRLLVFGGPYALWQEAELALMGDLKDDFLVGSVAADRDQLMIDYASAMSAQPWTVMGFGCGLAAAEGFRNYARELAEGFQFITGGPFVAAPSGDPEPWIVVDYYPGPGTVIDIYTPDAEKYQIVDVPMPIVVEEIEDLPPEVRAPGRQTPSVPIDLLDDSEDDDEIQSINGGPFLPGPTVPSVFEMVCGDACPNGVAGLRAQPFEGNLPGGDDWSFGGMVCVCQP